MAYTNGNSKTIDSNTMWKEIVENLETIAITETRNPSKFSSKCVVTPIVTSSMFALDGFGSQDAEHEVDGERPPVYEYSRWRNPTRDVAEKTLASLEGSKYALLFGSGCAAVSTVTDLLVQGDHLVSTKAIYGGSLEIYKNLSRFGITFDFVKENTIDEFVRLIKPNTKLLTLESPSNPSMKIIDLAELVKRVRAVNPNIILALDNTFMTPVLQRPLEHGFDLVIYSCSKYIGGHGDLIMGAVTTNSYQLYKRMHDSQIRSGNITSAFECYLLIRSLKTLPLRMKRHSESALVVARFLESHPSVEKVIYPGLTSHPQHKLAIQQQYGGSGMIGFYIKNAGIEEAGKFLTSLRVVVNAASLGADVSLASIPAKISHKYSPEDEKRELGILDNFIRLSVGLENPTSLIKDLEQALKAAFL